MPSPWLAWPAGSDPHTLARQVRRAHADFVAGVLDDPVRSVVLSSWQRCAALGVDPDTHGPVPDLDDTALALYRATHPLAAAMPLVRRLLVEDAVEADLVVAVADAAGRLLWVEGSSALRWRAQDIGFVEGVRWDEAHAGTNAPGLALATEHAVQVFAGEHYSRAVHPWSCSAAPVHDPVTGQLLGVIDVTGGDAVAAPHALAIVRSVAAAVERELLILAARPGWEAPSSPALDPCEHPPTVPLAAAWQLQVLGRDDALLTHTGQLQRLSRRHSEMVFLLVEHPAGLSAEQLDVALHPADSAVVTVRAEMSRLRRLLGEQRIASRPYQLVGDWGSDADAVRARLRAGELAAAVSAYPGPVLPGSEAPRVVEARVELREHLRQALLAGGAVDALLDYGRGGDALLDVEVWRAALGRLAPADPRHSEVRAHLALLAQELDATWLQPPRS